MSRREQQKKTENNNFHKQESYNSDKEEIVIETNKIAIVDTDILFHWALSFIDDNATLDEAKLESERVLLNFENTLRAKAYIYFIKGSGNFRYTVATIKPYKGTRTSEKHKFYYEILEHMTLFRDCIRCNSLEADDMVSIFHDDRTIVCTNDKDAKQNAGDIYNFTKKEITTISKDEAWENLWLQVLTGDSVDNIGGLEGIGPAKAKQILQDVPTEDYPQTILQEYISKHGLIHGSDAFNENYQLIRMKTSNGKYIKEKYKDIFALIDLIHEL
jgi:hypothetical protein